ncbi:hypothetical protein A6R68_13670 [Neotoma lepida]|uniref:GAB2 n=1 Tax=Neotoma lepida TaxID=56216 RepID=A0A1A6GZJ3_NEOLE|nr:hypothetical protein A6R68_13670 [Neotoma lepida]
MSGDPDVLAYYKNKHSKKPLQISNLNFCEQVDAGLTFNKKGLQDSFMFDIKTRKTIMGRSDSASFGDSYVPMN